MSSLYGRKDSESSYQVAVSVPTQTGVKKRVIGSIATIDTKKAEKVSEKIQELADALKEKRTSAQLLRFIGAILDAAGVVAPWEMVAESVDFLHFARGWIDRKYLTGSRTALNAANATVESFYAHTGVKNLTAIKGQQIQSWVDSLVANGFAPNTVTQRLSTLKAVFKHAMNMGTIRTNPAAEIEAPKAGGVVNRQDFPDEVFQRVFSWLCSSTFENSVSWQAAMMLGRYGGLRLRDAVNAKQADFTPQKGDASAILCYTARKTGRNVCIPVFMPLDNFLTNVASRGGIYFCEGLQDRKPTFLSETFSRIIALAGVENPKTPVASGRAFNSYSFHGLRHSFCTTLAKMGIPETLRMKLADHTSIRSHRGYDHSSAADLAGQLQQYFK